MLFLGTLSVNPWLYFGYQNFLLQMALGVFGAEGNKTRWCESSCAGLRSRRACRHTLLQGRILMSTTLLGEPARLSRRALLRASVGAAAMLGTAAPAAAQIKVSKPSVAYQDQPDGNRRCALCAHFVAPGSCRIVAGPISPQGWCRLFAAASRNG